jgi:hypothetical protein
VAKINRQVVLEGIGGEGVGNLAGLTEKEILTKAQLAIEMLAKDGAKEAESVQFIYARKTAKGAILITKTVEAARWLKDEATMGHFAEKLGGTILARADLCMLVAEYVPTSFDPDLYSAFGQVEKDNGLRKGALREARYIKQKKHRRDGQRSAHMIMGFTDTEQANLAIRNGLVIESKHISLRRHRTDPQRCLKCQKIGVAHRAAECKSIHDTCGRCAGLHRTDTCTVDNPEEFQCVNCKVSGHASVDRNCPVFMGKMRISHAKFPDYQYRYFPTEDPQSWEIEDYGITTPENDRKGTDNMQKAANEGTGNNQVEQGHGHSNNLNYNQNQNHNHNQNHNRNHNNSYFSEPFRYGSNRTGMNGIQPRNGATQPSWQRDRGWEDARDAQPRAGRGRGNSTGGGIMHQSTLESAFGPTSGGNEVTIEPATRRWGDEPMTDEAGPLRSQYSASSLYA